MARYGFGGAYRAITHPYYQRPQPPPGQPRRPTQLLSSRYPRYRLIDGLDDSVYLMVLGDDASANEVIFLPRDYDGSDDDEYWREQTSGYQVLKTSLAYERLRGDHPHIARYLRRDPWNGLPILARPTGPSLNEFIGNHQAKMYPAGHVISDIFLPLVLNWALQALSALKFIHSHNDFYYNDLTVYNCWLSSDLTLSLIGFLHAEFRDGWGQLNDGSGERKGSLMRMTIVKPRADVQSDLFDWGTFMYQLMTNIDPREEDHDEAYRQIQAQRFPNLSKDLAGELVAKCWRQYYLNVDELRADMVQFMKGKGYDVEEHSDIIKGFYLENMSEFAIDQ
ncbi:hypothetical protein F5884DRAFT_887029 [Xylogone sp. PMI_703]|nr:hypothetical protein F5884DRAFT_887029 [Xylogone sp. PMI_703]